MISDFLTVRILHECHAGHAGSTSRLPRQVAESMVKSGQAEICQEQGQEVRSMRRQLLRSASDGRLERPGLLELLSEGGPERREARRGHKQRRRREEC